MRWLLGLSLALVACGQDAEIALQGASGGNGGTAGCKASSDCTGENEKCASDHECRHLCQSSDQCGEYVCMTSEGVCVECQFESDCGEYGHCSASHECRECLSNEQCTPPKYCDPVEFQCKG